MAGKSILLGSSTRYSNGAATRGAAPVKPYGVGSGSYIKSRKSQLIVGVVQPVDPRRVRSRVFVLPGAGAQPPFPAGSSPLEVFSGTKAEISDGIVVGRSYHVWVVNYDRYDYPNPETDSNATYLGHVVVTAATTATVGSIT